MKNLIIGILILTGTNFYAQSDKMITSKVKKEIKVNNKGELYTTKVKVETKKVKYTKMNPNQKHQLNQARIKSPVTVTKTIMIDNDNDPFYDDSIKIKYYKYKGKKYNFSANEDGLLISKNDESNKAIKSKKYNYYIIHGTELNGVGYFNEENDFVVEYYDQVIGDTELAIFEDLKM